MGVAIDINHSKIIKYCENNFYAKETIIETNGFVEGIAINWVGKNILWADSRHKTIGISNYHGNMTGSIPITNNDKNYEHIFEKPRSIVTDPNKGNSNINMN